MYSRFLTLDQVAEELAVSRAQAYTLVRSGELPAVKLSGRGQWRVEPTELELYIQRQYAETPASCSSTRDPVSAPPKKTRRADHVFR